MFAQLFDSKGIEMQCSHGAACCCVSQPTIYFNCWGPFSLLFDASLLLCSFSVHPVSQRLLLLSSCLRNAGRASPHSSST